MFKKWTSQDFHQLTFEFLHHVHGNTGSRSWTGMDFVLEPPSTSDSDETLTGDGQLFQARLDGFSTLFSGTHTELGWPWWPQPRVMRTFLVWDHLSGGLQMLKHCFHKSKEKNKRNRDSLKAQSSRFWVQIPHMQLMASVVSVVLFCKLLIAYPFVHFCDPVASFHHIFPFSCTKTSLWQSSPLLLWVKVHGIVIVLLYILHNWV